MKKRGIIFFATLMIISIWTIITPNRVNAQGYGQVSLDLFYNELSPYGHWDNDPHHGDIWFPTVEANFRPYGTNGYWTMTNYGNTWVSNYAWGWAPFHYGRWVHTDYRGWGWIPGYEWGPAWVDWRSGNGYYGWAPMAPGVSINISIGLPLNLWIFAPSRQIYNRNIYRYSSYGRPNIYNNTTIINNTYIVNNHHYHGGPSRQDVERSVGRRVTVRDIRHTERPGASRSDSRSVSIYRPDRNSTSRSDRNDRLANIDRNTNSNRISREMYIGKDGTSTVRERNTEVKRDNMRNTSPRNDNRSTGSSRVTREMQIGKDGTATIREKNTEAKHNQTSTRSTPSEENKNRPTDRTVERAGQRENRSNQSDIRTTRSENEARTRNRLEQSTPMRPSESRKSERENRPVQEKRQPQERKSSNTVYTASQTSSSRNTNRTEQMSRESRSTPSPSIGRSSNRERQSSTVSPSSSSENTSRRNR